MKDQILNEIKMNDSTDFQTPIVPERNEKLMESALIRCDTTKKIWLNMRYEYFSET